MATSLIRKALVLSLLLLAPVAASAQNPEPGRVPVVLILPFDTERTGRAPAPGTSETLAEVLGGVLIESGAFRVMDSNWLEVARPTTTGRGEVRSRALAANVDYVIEGALSQYNVAERRRTIGGLPFVRALGGITRATTDSETEILIRIIDVRTGEVVSTTTGRGSAKHSTGGLAVGGLIHGMPGLVGGVTSATGVKQKLANDAIGGAREMAARGVINAAARLQKSAGEIR